jgi:PPP family 3-phenylpropionic acid transporter
VTLLASLYFLVFSMMGVYAPWLPPFLADRGLSPSAMGIALGSVSICRVVFPPAWGALADHTEHKRTLLAATAALAGAAIASLPAVSSTAWAVGGLLVYGFFLTPVVPLLEAATLTALSDKRWLYGRVRLWGSIGFIVSSVGLGWLIPRLGMSSVAFAAGLPLLAFGLLALAAPSPTKSAAPKEHVAWRSLPWRRLTPVLVATVLGQASHGPYYAFFSLQLTARGVSTLLTGALWALGVIAETFLMALSPRIFARMSYMTAIRWALMLTAVRWLLYASTGSLVLIAIGQTLHAASYALLHLATIQWVDAVVPPSRRALGQAILSACGYGLGVGGGLAAAGMVARPLGFSGMYLCAAAMCALGLVVLRGKHASGVNRL